MRTILITIDALRRDHLICYGYDRETTPFLETLVEENSTFRNCYASSCHTREAIPSILTGERPENCVDSSYRINSETIPEALPDDISTEALTTGCYLTKVENHDRGFDRFKSDYTFENSFLTRQTEYIERVIRNRPFRDAETQIDRTLESIEDGNDFIWTHLMDTHAPYNQFDEWHWGEEVSGRRLQYIFRKANHFSRAMSEEERQALIDAYDNCIRFIDRQLERLFENISEDVEVFIVGDHGEYLGENGRYEHPRELSDELLKVPLIVRNGREKEFNRKVSTMDIAPTILERYGSKTESDRTSLYRNSDRSIKSSCLKNGERIHREFT
mgnify:CR=1 FL=1